MQDDSILSEYAEMIAMGLPCPEDADFDIWQQAKLKANSAPIARFKEELSTAIEKLVETPMPQDDKGVLKYFFLPAVKTRVEVMLDPRSKPAERLAASDTFIEHTVGKPQQTVEHTGSIAMEVHSQLEKLCRDIRSGDVIDTNNLLAKPSAPVQNFLEANMPKGFIVGKKGPVDG